MSTAAAEIHSQPPTRTYPCKWVVDDTGREIPIVLQGENGPCALLALLNVQFQRGALSLAPNTPKIPETLAMSMLADLASQGAQRLSDQPEVQAQRESAVHHFVDLLPSLSQGMHVNVRFSSPTAFEFTKEIAAFDCFPDIQLVHGWLVDPQDEALTKALGNMSYNQVMDEMVKLNSVTENTDGSSSSTPSAPPAPEQEVINESADAILPPAVSSSSAEFGHIDISVPTHLLPPEQESAPESKHEETLPSIEQLNIQPETTSLISQHAARVWEFFDTFPSMLTYHGIAELNALLQDGETTILFRNSHFYVLRKHKQYLYTLATDVGYEKEIDIAWELLRDVNGDSDFFSASFTPSVLNQDRPAVSTAAAMSGADPSRITGSPVTPPQRPSGIPGSSSSPERRPDCNQARNTQRKGQKAAGSSSATGNPGGQSGRSSGRKRTEDLCCIQ